MTFMHGQNSRRDYAELVNAEGGCFLIAYAKSTLINIIQARCR